MCSFVTNLSSSCLCFKARSSELRTHIGTKSQWPRFIGCITFYCLLQVKVPRSHASRLSLSWMHRDERETRFIYLFWEFIPERVLVSSLMFIQLKWSGYEYFIRFDFPQVLFTSVGCKKKSNVKVRTYRILNFPIENHIKIKTWFLSHLSLYGRREQVWTF